MPDAAAAPPYDRALSAARVVVVASALLAPFAHAALLPERPQLLWLSTAALAVAGLIRIAAPAAALPVVLGVGPLWQLLTARLLGESDPHVVAAWLGAVAVAGVWPAARWQSTGWWRLGLASWGLALAVGWPLVAGRELDFTLRTLTVATLNGSWGATPHESAAFAVLAASAQLAAILLFDWYAGAAAAARARVWRALVPGLVLGCALALWQARVDVSLFSRQPWIWYGRAAGTFYDANAMGALAALLGLTAAARGFAGGRWAAVGGLALLALALAAVTATGSRAALAAMTLAAGTALASAVGRGRGWPRALAVGILLAAVLAAASRDGASGGALPRLRASLEAIGRGGGAVAREELWDRYGYGPASMAMIADHPWAGVGIGVLGTVVSDYGSLTLGRPLPPDSAQNWWRQQWAELGAFGAAGAFLCSWLALGAFAAAWRRRRAGVWDAAPLLALGVMSAVGAPTQHPIVAAVVGLVVARAVLGTPSAPQSTRNPAPLSIAGAGAGAWPWLLAAASATAILVSAVRDFRPPLRAERFGFPYAYGFAAGAGPQGGEGAWAATRAVGVVGTGRTLLALRVILPHADLAAKPVRLTIAGREGVRCTAEVTNASPVSCDLPVGPSGWTMVRIDVERPGPGGTPRSAFVTWRFDP